MNNENKIILSPWLTIVFYAMYALVSIFIFSASTFGWSSVAGISLSIFTYFILGAIYLIAIIVLGYKGMKKIIFSVKSLMILSAVQFFTILFNTGDCGDAGGDWTFIKYITGMPVCRSGDFNGLMHNLAYLWSSLLFLVYFVLLVIFMVNSLKDSLPINKKVKK